MREFAATIEAEISGLPICDAKNCRALRRRYTRLLKPASGESVLQLARILNRKDDLRGFAYELIYYHPPAFHLLDAAVLNELGQGIKSWWTVDGFARILSGPAWLAGQDSDQVILKWARSDDHWWRRAALVSTVALNTKSQGGTGDVARTLRVCRLLAADREDMVAKALSWALRRLVGYDASAVREFLAEYDEVLPALVKREVKNKLRTGLKNPKQRGLLERRSG